MAIDPERVKALFQASIERDDPSHRRAFLDDEIGDDAGLRKRLDALLADYDQSPGALDRPLVADPHTADATRSLTAPPPRGIADVGRALDQPKDDGPNLIDTIIADRYKLRQEIGEGGMGTVYLAEQLRPVRRMVALKLIKPGMDSRNVLARFDSERQALAVMDHQHIARVLDAGSTAEGRPFFVMELVKGIPITEYCDRHRLDLPARLGLFRQVCSAVQHAHQKGIIHRDLKPSNILVEAHDDKPVPKVIDFGLAKATSGLRLTEQSLFTAFGSVAGTPLYMAPEQASFNALDVDTRADIYALGVILYELLTGSTPIRRETMQRAAFDEMLRVIREDEPPTPSSRISTSEALPSLAASRHAEPARLSRLVRGELDWIVMKALSKERERRYASAISLADDIERHLNHEPVSAGPPTVAYRVSKFVRRNRAQVVAAALVLVALCLGVIGTTLSLFEARRQERIAVKEAHATEDARKDEAEQRRIAEEQRHSAETRLGQVSKMNEILGSIFRDLDVRKVKTENRPLESVLAERLDKATAAIEGEATGDPLAVARMQMDLGRSQNNLGYPARAIELFTKARATLATVLGPDHPDTLTCMRNLAVGYAQSGQVDRAVPLFEETLALMRSKLGFDHRETLLCMHNLAISYSAAGQHDRALKLHGETLALRKSKLGPDDPDTLSSMNNLALSYSVAGQHDRALKLHEETLALKRSKLGSDHPDTLSSMNNVANSYSATGQKVRATKLYEETLALRRAKLGPDHPDTLSSMNNLAVIYHITGQNDRAIKLREATLAIERSKLGSDHPRTLKGMNNLAVLYSAAGQRDRAIKLIEETVALKRVKLGPDHLETLDSLEILAQCLADSGQLDRAGVVLIDVIASRRKAQGDGHPSTLVSRLTRAELDLASGGLNIDIAADQAILDECRTRLGPDDRITIVACLVMARVQDARGDREKALPLYQAALESARKKPTDREMLAAAVTESGRSRLVAADWPAAETLCREALGIREAEMPEHWQTAENRSLLGGALLGQKKPALAAPLLRSGYEGMARASAAIPLVERPRLAEALDRLIAAGLAAGTNAEVEAWKVERAKVGAGGPKP